MQLCQKRRASCIYMYCPLASKHLLSHYWSIIHSYATYDSIHVSFIPILTTRRHIHCRRKDHNKHQRQKAASCLYLWNNQRVHMTTVGASYRWWLVNFIWYIMPRRTSFISQRLIYAGLNHAASTVKGPRLKPAGNNHVSLFFFYFMNQSINLPFLHIIFLLSNILQMQLSFLLVFINRSVSFSSDWATGKRRFNAATFLWKLPLKTFNFPWKQQDDKRF